MGCKFIKKKKKKIILRAYGHSITGVTKSSHAFNQYIRRLKIVKIHSKKNFFRYYLLYVGTILYGNLQAKLKNGGTSTVNSILYMNILYGTVPTGTYVLY